MVTSTVVSCATGDYAGKTDFDAAGGLTSDEFSKLSDGNRG
jgi:hypothetical protein